MPRKKLPRLLQTVRDRDLLKKIKYDIITKDGRRGTVSLPDVDLTSFGLQLGDLVQYGGQGVNGGGIVWRIVGDKKPRIDAVNAPDTGDGIKRYGWFDPDTHRRLSYGGLRGGIIIRPEFSFLPFVPSRPLDAWATPKSKTISYQCLAKRIKKVDIVVLAARWSELKDLIEKTVRERSE